MNKIQEEQLVDYLSKQANILDADFYLEGINSCELNRIPREQWQKIVKGQIIAKWWIFCKQN